MRLFVKNFTLVKESADSFLHLSAGAAMLAAVLYSLPRCLLIALEWKHLSLRNKASGEDEKGNRVTREWLHKFSKTSTAKKGQKAGPNRSTSQDQDSRNSEYATAVLATAFAIHSLQEAKTTGRKEVKANGLQLRPHTNNEVTKRPSYNKTKSPADKPSRSSSFLSKPAVDHLEKVERHEKLKSVLAWANGKKMKAKTEKTNM